MYKGKTARKLKKINTLVGPGAVFHGTLQCKGNIRIEGSVKGDLETDGDVFIGDSAIIIGNITANNVTSGGAIEGNVTSRGLLNILSTARLIGDIVTGGLIADEGCTFTGRCQMNKTPKKVLEILIKDRRDKNINPNKQAIGL